MQSSAGDMQSSGDDMQSSAGDMQSSGGDMQSSGGDMQSSGDDMQSSAGDMADSPLGSSLELLAGAIGGLGNADDIGAAARFSWPLGVTADGAGNLYVADSLNYTVRKVVLATGAVSTVAGVAGKSGSADGTGATARFSEPDALAADGAGNLYMVDAGSTVRKIVLATGAVSTIAGAPGRFGSADGTGAAARFQSAGGLALDGAGNLYVADTGNFTIRKIVLATGVVSTIAGVAGSIGSADGTGSAARFNWPHQLAADGADNLYVTDTNNYTIRKLVLATGAVSTIAGTPGMLGSVDGIGAAARFKGSNGLAVDGAGNLFVVDNFNGDTAIRKVVLATGMVTTIAGTAGTSGSSDGIGAAARFKNATAVAADGAGNLYVADTSNNTIRKVVLATAEVSTIAGAATLYGSTDGVGTAARFNGPQAVAADAIGNLYVADSSNSTIRKVVPTTGEVSTIAGTAGVFGSADGSGAAAKFYYPGGVVADGAGNLYVADSANSTIRKIVLATGMVSTIAGTAFRKGSTDGTGAAARFDWPLGMAMDGAGNLYVIDSLNNTIRKIALATAEVSTIAGTAGMLGSADGPGAMARFSRPQGMAADGAGNLYIADAGNNTIRKIALATAEVSTIAGTAGLAGSTDGIGAGVRFNYPYGVAADGAGHLYIVDGSNYTIRKLALVNGSVTTPLGRTGERGVKLGPLPARLNSPSVTVMPTGKLMISEAIENAILTVR